MPEEFVHPDLKMLPFFRMITWLLSGVNFTLARGEFVYLIGRVGSGKSSLIKTINAELPLKDRIGQCGRIFIWKI